jgi:hypothetical protein
VATLDVFLRARLTVIRHGADALGFGNGLRMKTQLLFRPLPETTTHLASSGSPVPAFWFALHRSQRAAELPPRQHPQLIDRPHVLDAVVVFPEHITSSARARESKDGSGFRQCAIISQPCRRTTYLSIPAGRRIDHRHRHRALA